MYQIFSPNIMMLAERNLRNCFFCDMFIPMKHYRLEDLPFEPVSHDPALRKRVIVHENILPRIRGVSHIVLPPGSRASEHSHPDGYEIFYCVRGNVLFSVEGDGVPFSSSQCLIVEPGETHALEALAESELVYFFLKSS